MGKQKGKLASDFKVRKAKVGKRMVAPANVTNTSFKWSKLHIAGTSALSEPSADAVSAFRDRLIATKHHNADNRGEALERLRQLCVAEPAAMLSNLGDCIRGLSERLMDPEAACRSAALAIIGHIAATTPHAALAPFAPMLLAYLVSAFSSLQPSIRLDALAALALLHRHQPAIVHGSMSTLLPHILPLLEPQQQSLVTRTMLAAVVPQRLGLGASATISMPASSSSATRAGAASAGAGASAGASGDAALFAKKLTATEQRLAVAHVLATMLEAMASGGGGGGASADAPAVESAAAAAYASQLLHASMVVMPAASPVANAFSAASAASASDGAVALADGASSGAAGGSDGHSLAGAGRTGIVARLIAAPTLPLLAAAGAGSASSSDAGSLPSGGASATAGASLAVSADILRLLLNVWSECSPEEVHAAAGAGGAMTADATAGGDSTASPLAATASALAAHRASSSAGGVIAAAAAAAEAVSDSGEAVQRLSAVAHAMGRVASTVAASQPAALPLAVAADTAASTGPATTGDVVPGLSAIIEAVRTPPPGTSSSAGAAVAATAPGTLHASLASVSALSPVSLPPSTPLDRVISDAVTQLRTVTRRSPHGVPRHLQRHYATMQRAAVARLSHTLRHLLSRALVGHVFKLWPLRSSSLDGAATSAAPGAGAAATASCDDQRAFVDVNLRVAEAVLAMLPRPHALQHAQAFLTAVHAATSTGVAPATAAAASSAASLAAASATDNRFALLARKRKAEVVAPSPAAAAPAAGAAAAPSAAGSAAAAPATATSGFKRKREQKAERAAARRAAVGAGAAAAGPAGAFGDARAWSLVGSSSLPATASSHAVSMSMAMTAAAGSDGASTSLVTSSLPAPIVGMGDAEQQAWATAVTAAATGFYDAALLDEDDDLVDDGREAQLPAAVAALLAKKRKLDDGSAEATTAGSTDATADVAATVEPAPEEDPAAVAAAAARSTLATFRSRKLVGMVRKGLDASLSVMQSLGQWLVAVFNHVTASFASGRRSPASIASDPFLRALPGVLGVMDALLPRLEAFSAALTAGDASGSGATSGVVAAGDVLAAFAALHDALPPRTSYKAATTAHLCLLLQHQRRDAVGVDGPDAPNGVALPASVSERWLQSLPKLLWGLQGADPATSHAIALVLLREARAAAPYSARAALLKGIVRQCAPLLLVTTKPPAGVAADATAAQPAVAGPFMALPHATQTALLHFMQSVGGLTPQLRRGLLFAARAPTASADLRRGILRCAMSMIALDVGTSDDAGEASGAAPVDTVTGSGTSDAVMTAVGAHATTPASDAGLTTSLLESAAFLLSWLTGREVTPATDGTSSFDVTEPLAAPSADLATSWPDVLAAGSEALLHTACRAGSSAALTTFSATTLAALQAHLQSPAPSVAPGAAVRDAEVVLHLWAALMRAAAQHGGTAALASAIAGEWTPLLVASLATLAVDAPPSGGATAAAKSASAPSASARLPVVTEVLLEHASHLLVAVFDAIAAARAPGSGAAGASSPAAATTAPSGALGLVAVACLRHVRFSGAVASAPPVRAAFQRLAAACAGAGRAAADSLAVEVDVARRMLGLSAAA